MVLVLVLLCCFVGVFFYEVICFMSYLVTLFLCFSVLLALQLPHLGKRANLSAFRTFVQFVLVWISCFPLPLGVWEGLRFVTVALPGLFSYLFFLLYKGICFKSCTVLFCSCNFRSFQHCDNLTWGITANLSSFVRFALVWFCLFPLPLLVWDGLRSVIMALPRLFSYLFFLFFFFFFFFFLFFTLDICIPCLPIHHL